MSKLGVNISGYINKQFGLGEGVRSNIRSIKTTGINYVLNDFNIQIPQFVGEEKLEQLDDSNPYPINLIQINVDKLNDVMSSVDKSYFEDKYNIAFWAWELEEFPEKSRVFFGLFNEIWVPSNFCTEAISKVSPVPVLKFMHSIEIETPTLTRRDLELPEDKFIFLGMFDYYSTIARKNPIGIIDAYEKAFGKNNNEVLLVLKSSISKEFPKEKAIINDRIGNNKSIILIEEIMDRNKLYSLMNSCDCFISLHRSEGFGLTMAEAMYLGKPVIATGYSANTEFMNLNNSFLVKYNMVTTGNCYYFTKGTEVWADPITDHASELMAFVFNNPEETRKIAEKGRQDIHDNLSPIKLGKKIESRLKLIEDELLPNPNQGKGSPSNKETILQVENKLLQQKIDTLKSYFPIKMKLAFKNMKNKLSGSKRKYMWE